MASIFESFVPSLRSFVRRRLGYLVFRRVSQRSFAAGQEIYELRFGPHEAYHFDYFPQYLSQKDWKQYGRIHAPSFTGTTTPIHLRSHDQWKTAAILFRSENFATFDCLSLKFSPVSGTTSLPRVGDLICGLVEEKDGAACFTHWFVASEQFYRAMTLACLEDHPASQVATCLFRVR